MAVSNLKTTGELYAFYNQCNGKSEQQNRMTNSAYAEREKAHSEKIQKMKSLIRGEGKENQNRPKSIIESSLEYRDKLYSSRSNAKDTTNELKKLKYNFKNIANRIRRSKTSVNAKQVALQARREVVQLKAKLQTGKYDKEELEAAIEHAKSMERAAKKKARHLEEEELIRISDKSNGTGMQVSEFEEEIEYQEEEEIAEYEEQLQEAEQESIEEMSEEMYDLLEDSMEEMMEESLENLLDGMMVLTEFEMSEDEYKAFKQKHRMSEDKTMLEADAKYLKDIFENMDINVPNVVDFSV